MSFSSRMLKYSGSSWNASVVYSSFERSRSSAVARMSSWSNASEPGSPPTGNESTEVRWFPVGGLPGSLAFDHDDILATALDRLRSKLEYTTLAFQLLPEYFSILELKDIYSRIWGE